MSRDAELEEVLHPAPSPAERDAVRLALAGSARAQRLDSGEASAWCAAGLRESADRDPQEAVPRSSRGATRA